MKRQKAGTEKLPPEDLRTMVQELHTSKKELEIRNEKLRRARKEADAERTWYAELYENARSAISPMTPTAS